MAKFDEFFKYLRQNGAKFDKLKVRYYGPGWRGVHASRDIEKDELVLVLPKNLLIHADLVNESQVIKDISNIKDWKTTREYENFQFAIWILQEEKKPDTPFKTYFEIMPKTYENFPIFYNDDENKLVERSQLASEVAQIQTAIQNARGLIFRNIKGAGGKFKWNDTQFAEAFTKVRSRIFLVNINGEKKKVMAPVADMLNHDEKYNVIWEYSD